MKPRSYSNDARGFLPEWEWDIPERAVATLAHHFGNVIYDEIEKRAEIEILPNGNGSEFWIEFRVLEDWFFSARMDDAIMSSRSLWSDEQSFGLAKLLRNIADRLERKAGE